MPHDDHLKINMYLILFAEEENKEGCNQTDEQ